MIVSDTFSKMKEENKRQERELTNKIIEGNDTLTNTLDKIKNNMEKKNIDSKMQYKNFIQNKQVTTKNEINNNMLIQEPEEENKDYEKNMNFPVQYPKYNYENNKDFNFMKKINTNSNQFVSEQQFPILSEQDIMSNNSLNNPQQTFNIKPNQENYTNLNNENINNQNNDKNIIQESNQNNRMNNTFHLAEQNQQYVQTNGNKIQNIQTKNINKNIINNNLRQTKSPTLIENNNDNINNNFENNNNNNFNEEIQNPNYQNTSNFDSKNQFNENFNQTNQSSNFGNVSQQGFTNTNNSTNEKITNSQLNNSNNLTNKYSDKENNYPPKNKRFYYPQNKKRENEFYETNKNINNNQSTGNNFNNNNKNMNLNNNFNNEKRQNDNFYNTNFSNSNPEEKLINAQKEYLKVKTQIDILKKERDYIERKILERPYPLGYIPDYEKLRKKAKLKMRNRYNTTSSNNNINSNRNKLTFGNDNFDKKIYKKKVLNQLTDAEIYSGIGSTRDILEGFVDRCVERSLYIYRNKNCHTCAKLLALGKSTSNCPKCHNLFEYPVNSRTSRK